MHEEPRTNRQADLVSVGRPHIIRVDRAPLDIDKFNNFHNYVIN